MGHQLGEVELHVDAGLRRAEPAPLTWVSKGRCSLAVLPGLAKLVGRHEHRRQRRTRLRLQEAETLGQLVRNQVAQADVVDHPDQLDV
jgi:hypothetical protein